VLYRAHYHAIELQLELSRRGIPYLITSGVRFFEQAHVKDVTSFVRFVANPRDEVAFKRMVKLLPGIGNKSADNHWRAWEAGLNERGEITSWGERLLAMPVGAFEAAEIGAFAGTGAGDEERHTGLLRLSAQARREQHDRSGQDGARLVHGGASADC